MSEPRFWVAVAARDLVDAAVADGYVEVNHGKAPPLERMHAGDCVAYYSPRQSYPKGALLQAFTAIGVVRDAPLFQATDAHQPFRRAVQWQPCAPAPVRPLLDALSFVRNKLHWGHAFRFGYLRVPPADFAIIAAAVGDSRTAAIASAAAPPPVSVDVAPVHAPIPADESSRLQPPRAEAGA
jgi:hypothetical protein